MKRKVMALMCLAAMLLALTGCQLAKEDQGTEVREDKLVGLYITTEYLDLFNFDSYLEDHIGKLSGGGEFVVEGDTQKYQGRLYATLKPRGDSGVATHEYVFENVPGMAFFAPAVPEMDGHEGYITLMTDEGIIEPHQDLKYTNENEESITLKGTMYVAPSGKKERIYYFNPVYQTQDGSVYTVSGSGFVVENENYSQGSVYSQTLDASSTITENGKTQKESFSITLAMEYLYAPTKIAVCQVDQDYSLLLRTEYAPDAMPEKITPEKETAFFIVETHCLDDKGNALIKREICDRDAQSIVTFVVREDGVCIRHGMRIE